MQVHSSHSFTAWLSLWGLFLCFAIIVQGRLEMRRLGYDLHCDRKLIMGHIGSCCMRLSFLSVCHDAGHCFFSFNDLRPLLSHPLYPCFMAQRMHFTTSSESIFYAFWGPLRRSHSAAPLCCAEIQAWTSLASVGEYLVKSHVSDRNCLKVSATQDWILWGRTDWFSAARKATG